MESEAHVGVIVSNSDSKTFGSIYVVPESGFNEAELTETKEDTSEFVAARYSEYRQDFIDFSSVDQAVTKFFVIMKPPKDSLTLRYVLPERKLPPLPLTPEDYCIYDPWFYQRPQSMFPSGHHDCSVLSEGRWVIGGDDDDDDDDDDYDEQSKE